MSNTDDSRWQRRFENFQSAYSKLAEISERNLDDYSLLEKEGMIQRFEYTYELAWKTLKDWLFIQGYDEKTPRDVVQRSFEVELLSEQDTEYFLEGLRERNLTSHTYDEATAQKILTNIKEIYQPMLARLYQTLRTNFTK